MTLTQRDIDRAEVRSKDYRLSDSKGLGLSVRIYKSGAKTFFFRYRNQDGRAKDFRIGDAGLVSLKTARAKAISLKSRIEHGEDIDPTKDQDSAELLLRHVIELFHASPEFSEYSEGTKRWHRSVCNHHLIPKLGERRFSELRMHDWYVFLRGLVSKEEGAGTARSAKNIGQSVYTWARMRGMVEFNVLREMKHIKPQQPRERVLSDNEIQALWHLMRSGKHGLEVANCTLFALLTAQRIGEVSSMRIEDLDFSEKIWLIPKTVAKNRKEHEVPLSDVSISLVREVIGRRKRGPVFSIHEKTVSNTLARYAKDARFRGKFTAHDLRRTFATCLPRIDEGVSDDLIRRVLNHAVKSDGALKHYNHYEYRDEKRRLVNVWSSHIVALATALKPECSAELVGAENG